jgi:hypothetical protein
MSEPQRPVLKSVGVSCASSYRVIGAWTAERQERLELATQGASAVAGISDHHAIELALHTSARLLAWLMERSLARSGRLYNRVTAIAYWLEDRVGLVPHAETRRGEGKGEV